MSNSEAEKAQTEETEQGDIVHTPPQHKSAYRRWFARLNPGVQLVIMQLWMPVFMCIMFIVCYVGAFHHIAPHNLPVGVVGTAAQAETYQARADKAAPGGFDFEVVHNESIAEQKVKAGDLGWPTCRAATPSSSPGPTRPRPPACSPLW